MPAVVTEAGPQKQGTDACPSLRRYNPEEKIVELTKTLSNDIKNKLKEGVQLWVPGVDHRLSRNFRSACHPSELTLRCSFCRAGAPPI